ncbi:hypothetical protein BJQ90_02918 [Arthrobacter sp. SO3]|nr:hypothetical protein [Arthrobacter sp. SO3]
MTADAASLKDSMFKLDALIHSGPVLAHSKFPQLSLEAGPAYRLARLSELMIGSGSVAISCRSPCIPA